MKKILFVVLAMCFAITTRAQDHQHPNATVIRGSANRDKIPDTTVENLYLLSLFQGSFSPEARVESLHLGDDRDRFLQAARQFIREHNQLVTDWNTHPGNPDSFAAAKKELIIRTWNNLRIVLSDKSMTKLNNLVQFQKQFVVIVGDPK